MSREGTGRNQICVTVPIANAPPGLGSENIGSTVPSATADSRAAMPPLLNSDARPFEWFQFAITKVARAAATKYAGYICQRAPSMQTWAIASTRAAIASTRIQTVHAALPASEAESKSKSAAMKRIWRSLIGSDCFCEPCREACNSRTIILDHLGVESAPRTKSIGSSRRECIAEYPYVLVLTDMSLA